jgi:hypothetical protein
MQHRTWHDVVRGLKVAELSRGRLTRPARRSKAAAFGQGVYIAAAAGEQAQTHILHTKLVLHITDTRLSVHKRQSRAAHATGL